APGGPAEGQGQGQEGQEGGDHGRLRVVQGHGGRVPLADEDRRRNAAGHVRQGGQDQGRLPGGDRHDQARGGEGQGGRTDQEVSGPRGAGSFPPKGGRGENGSCPPT